MRPILRTVCAITVLLLAPAIPARGQGTQPAKTPSSIGLHAYGVVDFDALAASESFDAVVGTSRLTAFGGGVDVVDIWKHLFVRVAVTRTRQSGSRVFVADNKEVSPLNLPLTVTMTPVEVGAGWRFVSSKGGLVTPYAGVSFLSMGYTETSKGADPGEDTNARFGGQDVFAGVEVGIVKWLVAAGEVQYRRVPNALGAGGVSKDFGESDLGGVTARVTIGIRTKR